MSTGLDHDLGLGIGWRQEIADFVTSLARGDRSEVGRLGFTEVVAENVDASALPPSLEALRKHGVTVVPHGISLSLGGSEPPDPDRLARLGRLASRLGSPFVSEHIAFVRAGGFEAGHLLPVPRTREALDVLVWNVQEAQEELPVPLALEHVAALVEWPGAEFSEAAFLAAVLEETGALLLLDLANVYANSVNHGFDAREWLDRVPLDRVAYVHVGGGTMRDGVYHDSHAHPVVDGVLELVEELCSRTRPPGVLLERDDRFPPAEQLAAELGSIAEAMQRGASRKEAGGAQPLQDIAGGLARLAPVGWREIRAPLA